MSNWIIRFYINARGDELVQDFVRKQDKVTISKIARSIDLVSVYGPDLGMPHSRYLSDGIYELRIRGKNEVRIFYIAVTAKREVIFLHAYKKRTQKMSNNEFEVALSRKKSLT
jgi:phage-related protein